MKVHLRKHFYRKKKGKMLVVNMFFFVENLQYILNRKKW
jgi:hypothetical protein